MSSLTTELLLILLLLLINGLLAMSEIAIVSARKTRLQQRAEAGDAGAAAALDLAREPTRFLSTVQIGITLVGILAGAFGARPLPPGARGQAAFGAIRQMIGQESCWLAARCTPRPSGWVAAAPTDPDHSRRAPATAGLALPGGRHHRRGGPRADSRRGAPADGARVRSPRDADSGADEPRLGRPTRVPSSYRSSWRVGGPPWLTSPTSRSRRSSSAEVRTRTSSVDGRPERW
jgi:hypothetical protein